MSADFSDVISQWRANSPRTNRLAGNFESIANGKSGVPVRTPLEDSDATDLFHGDACVNQFYEEMVPRFGVFGRHFISSVPYGLQEWARLGSAMTTFLSGIAQEENRATSMHSCGSAEGVIARTIAEVGKGNIYTLTNSSTPINKGEFERCGAPETAFFFSGPYFDLSPEVLGSIQGPERQAVNGWGAVSDQIVLRRPSEEAPFKNGFDIVFEDTCFQMHAPNRAEQIAWVARNLREDGLFICWEKCSLPGAEQEYLRRERIKDTEFKSLYFSQDQVAEKQATILNTMETGQVSLDALVDGISASFRHAAMIWNSGNFYILVASNDAGKLQKFCDGLIAPCIQPQFQHVGLPQTLLGPNLNLSFRAPETGVVGAPVRMVTGALRADTKMAGTETPGL
jgi:SAM-dependent methyltransferase